ncbi:glycosyltransferase [Pontibacter pamirensis]|uniref:glycosyltransferase n=1 Tax=Pontibacter pamirensis TaxID=2562824 RepID=UPI00138A2057|nr:glycosyltransferase [Pontibacter pamirensis]
MSGASNLIVFTYSYPYGFGEEWKYNEFNVLSGHFTHIIIQPYTYGNNKEIQRELPLNVTVNEPLISDPLNSIGLISKGFFNLSPVKFALADLVERKLYFRPKQFKFWLNSTLHVRHLSSHPFIQKLVSTKSPKTVLYFYWGTGPALMIPLFKQKNFSKIVAKFHGGDLYEERSNGYLPFRKSIFQTLTNALFISEQGLNYASKKYRINNGLVFRLGVKTYGFAKHSQDDTFRIVTCSSAIPIKRLSLLIEALFHVQFPVIWTHIGDGPLLPTLQKTASTLPNQIKANFLGFVPAHKVQEFYTEDTVDLFINVSETEGVPVSIMEALSAGIPVVATDVGGTHEIVNAENGKLIAPDISASELAGEISCFYNLPLTQKKRLREGAFQMFEKKSNADNLYESLAQFLVKD